MAPNPKFRRSEESTILRCLFADRLPRWQPWQKKPCMVLSLAVENGNNTLLLQFSVQVCQTIQLDVLLFLTGQTIPKTVISASGSEEDLKHFCSLRACTPISRFPFFFLNAKFCFSGLVAVAGLGALALLGVALPVP